MSEVLEPGIHAGVRSLAKGVAQLLKAVVLSVHAIGQAYASLAYIPPKSRITRVDLWLRNDGVRLDTLMQLWCKHIVGDSTWRTCTDASRRCVGAHRGL